LSGSPSLTEPVATVNGDKIEASLLYDAMQHYVPVKGPADANSATLTQPVGRIVLSELIQNVILLQVAKSKNAAVTDSLVDDRYNYIKTVEEKTNTTKPFDDYLAAEGYTPATFKDEQIKQLVARINLAALGQTITDAEVSAYYKQHPEKYTFPERVHIQRIVLGDKATADAAQADAQKAGSFKNFIGKSIDPPLTGGLDASDLPKWEALSGPGLQFPPQILNPLKAAKTGDVIAPLQLQPGHWWVIRVADKQPEYTMPFDQVKSIVKLDALAEKGMRSSSVIEVQQSLQTALQTANIVIGPKQYQPVAEQFKAKPRPMAPPMTSPPHQPAQTPPAKQ
jgi:parvulin-like peptidyl-prolyl isomerase